MVKKHIGPMTAEVWEREFVPLLPARGARALMRALALAAMLLLAPLAVRGRRRPALRGSGAQARYERVIRELRCLVCRNETIADSNAPLAADLRREVER